MIGAGKYLVLGKSTSTADNGGAPVAYSYGSFGLTNTEDAILLYDPNSKLIDKVEYKSSWSMPGGGSLSLKSPSLDNSVLTNWCEEGSTWTGSKGDYGSPGAKANCP